MRKQLLFVLGLCMAAFYGCDDNGSSTSGEEDACKTMTCKGGEHCDAGKCLCGDKECAADESCVENKCEKTSVPPDEDLCKDKTCGEGEHCDAGKCLCGDKECGDDEFCNGDVCISTIDDRPPECTPPCGEGEDCVDGACQPSVPILKCNPACKSESQYCDNEVCKDVQVPCACNDGETCSDSGECKCGNSKCNEDEYCEDNTCKPKDPCAGIECPAGQTCVNGNCKRVTLSPISMDVMLSSVSNKLVATSLDGSKLEWTITVDENTSNEDMPKDKDELLLKCRKSDKTLSTKLSECIIKKDNTETVQFVGYSRHLKTVTVAVKNSKGETAEATLTLKPYFDTGGFIKTDDIIYRNGYCPGQQMTKSNSDSIYYYNSKWDNFDANLGGIETKYGPANIYGEQTFSEEELAVIDKDMYLKYVHSKMFKGEDGGFYGTRASVVAAARFLILQFPYDIPYTSNGVNNHPKVLSHYLFTKGELDEVTKVDIHGLNLTSNAYNSSTKHDQSNIIRDDVVPWGGAYCEPDKCNYGSNNNKILEYPYNGLECTGFVTWAFRNGYLGLGDWNTNLFAKDGRCRKGGEAHEDGIDDKEVERNYKCKDIVNYDNGDYHDTSNRNNRLLLAYPKLNLLQDKDFVEITNKNEADLNDIFMDAKAGDLLLRHNTPTAADIKKYPNIDYKYGHIAMIIGLKRDSNQKVTSIYVGEAMPWSGNRLTTFKSMNDFSNSTDWVKLNKNSYKISFLVKMENVYNYYSEIKRVKKESANSDCPGNDKSSGNCYAYTENYNDEFNKALKMFELEDKK